MCPANLFQPISTSYYRYRLDPKPDPRYEKMYRDQQRNEDNTLGGDKVKRNPNDLRYNLMRRKSDGERRDRSVEREPMDAR